MADEAESIFKVFDKDFDGKLHSLEMHQALGAAGLCPSIEDVQLAVKEAGEGGGDIQLYKSLLEKFKNTKPTVDSLKPLFKVVDPSNTGNVDIGALRYLLENFNEKLADIETEEFLNKINIQKEEKNINIHELCNKLVNSIQ